MITFDALRTTIPRRIDELDWLNSLDDPDPESIGGRASEIVEEVPDRMAQLGFADFFNESLDYGAEWHCQQLLV